MIARNPVSTLPLRNRDRPDGLRVPRRTPPAASPHLIQHAERPAGDDPVQRQRTRRLELRTFAARDEHDSLRRRGRQHAAGASGSGGVALDVGGRTAQGGSRNLRNVVKPARASRVAALVMWAAGGLALGIPQHAFAAPPLLSIFASALNGPSPTYDTSVSNFFGSGTRAPAEVAADQLSEAIAAPNAPGESGNTLFVFRTRCRWLPADRVTLH